MPSRPARIASLMSLPGWKDVDAMLEEQISTLKCELYETMTRKPESLTGRKCLLNAGGIRALTDFRESIADEVRLLAPNRIGRAVKDQAGESPNQGE